jgi:hypothetical protein
VIPRTTILRSVIGSRSRSRSHVTIAGRSDLTEGGLHHAEGGDARARVHHHHVGAAAPFPAVSGPARRRPLHQDGVERPRARRDGARGRTCKVWGRCGGVWGRWGGGVAAHDVTEHEGGPDPPREDAPRCADSARSTAASGMRWRSEGGRSQTTASLILPSWNRRNSDLERGRGGEISARGQGRCGRRPNKGIRADVDRDTDPDLYLDLPSRSRSRSSIHNSLVPPEGPEPCGGLEVVSRRPDVSQ